MKPNHALSRWALVALAWLLVALPPLGGAAQSPAGLQVSADQALGEISPFVYGSNTGPWAVVPVDLWPQANSAGITWLRFPAGNWGDRNDITERQIDDFIKLCQRMGSLPSISVRLHNGTPEAAAELVRYANLEMGYDVRYWSIGNEPNLFGEDYDTERHAREWRAIAEAMLAVDPTITLLGPEVSQYPPDFASTPKDVNGRDWMSEFLKANGDLVDIITIHRYPFPQGRDPATIETLRQNSAEWETIIPNLRALILEITGREIPVAVTEVNSHWSNAFDGEATPDSFYNAIWWADVLGRLIRQQVAMVAHWALQTPTAYGSQGILGNFEVRPTYYVYLLYQQFGTELVQASSDRPDLSIYAALTPAGDLTLMVVNLADEPLTAPLSITGFSAADQAEVWRLDAEHNAESLGLATLEQQLTLPAQSVTLYRIPAAN
jgi:hypothetical protein